jgi:putative hydrolase of HD superfamily
MTDIERLIEFVKFTNEFRKIERKIYATGHPHPENDSEHSFQLALVAWYIIDSKKLMLDISATIRYALAHDLVEIYAGDTFIYTKDLAEKESKKEREEKAAIRIRNEFPEFPELHNLIDDYEEKSDPESRFIYALDKILPVITIYLDGGKGWHEWHVPLEGLLESKTSKVALSPEIEKYFHELVEILKKDEEKLFPKLQ